MVSQHIDTDVLRRAVPLVLIAVAVYFHLSPGLGDVDQRARVPMALFAPVAAGRIAFYDGLLSYSPQRSCRASSKRRSRLGAAEPETRNAYHAGNGGIHDRSG